MESDYLKLSEQYASFLAAVGGVSITVLALVLSFGSASVKEGSNSESTKGIARAFLVAALVVATVSCFVGAHMMAETAAFVSFHKGEVSGERLFLLASTNIFIAIILVLFAIMLLPTTSGMDDAASITPISISVFGCVIVGAVLWMMLAAKYRMPAPSGWLVILPPMLLSVLWGFFLCIFVRSRKWLLSLLFIPMVVFTVSLLLYFAWTFNKEGGGKVHDLDILLFSLTVTSSYTSLVVAAKKTMSVTKPLTLNAVNKVATEQVIQPDRE